LNSLFYFIETCAQNFESCLIVSIGNKCSTVVVAVIYMMFRYKWNVRKTLEFIYSRKSDVEITKAIISSLN